MAIIEINGLTKNFGSLTALDDISISLEPGRIVGLLGPNGSGKTTLIKILNGLLQPTSGSVSIKGNAPGIETKKIVAYLPDRNALPDYMNAKQLMELYADFFEDFDRAGAAAMIEDLGIDMEQTMKKMSKGTREKLQLCLVMARKAEVYLLDEVIFIREGRIVMSGGADEIREEKGESIDELFREVFKC